MGEFVHHEQRDSVHIIRFPPHAERESGFEQAVRSYFATDFLAEARGKLQVVVNLAHVHNMDSSGLGPLVQCLRDIQDQGGDLVLCGLHAPSLKEIFALTRFDRIFTIVEDEDAAIAHLHQRSDS
ncbi:MAG: anti-sigma factor antagonist [Planctomycetota bacterium]|nr:MAG: anti-sigma factor antagonist [Planctomycetota bacterium]